MKSPENSELSLVLVDDQKIAQLNYQYLGHKGHTNVISFSQQEEGFFFNHILGDVVVSVDTAYAEAEEFGSQPEEHLLRLIVHGILHLHGYHHEEDEVQAEIMENLTEDILCFIKTNN